MKLLLADDHTLFRDALVQFIERAEPSCEISLARDLHEAMSILEGDRDFDLVLLDFRMPGMNGVQGIRQVKKLYPDLKVAMMSGLAEQKDVEEALQSGVSAYFPKTLSGKALLSAMKDVMAGGRYVPVDYNTSGILPSYFGSSGYNQEFGNIKSEKMLKTPKHDVNLTPRETEVLSYLLQGASNKEIARDLDLQVVTVKLHVRGICRKLGAKNRTQAALIAKESGLA